MLASFCIPDDYDIFYIQSMDTARFALRMRACAYGSVDGASRPGRGASGMDDTIRYTERELANVAPASIQFPLGDY